MATSHIVYSSFFSRYDIVKQVSVMHGKSLIIQALRDLFRNDSHYPYREDEFGFPLVIDHTNIPYEYAGTEQTFDGSIQNPIPDEQLATKILITDVYRQDVKFYPVITVKQTGGSYFPISFNQNAWTIHYRSEYLHDGYGNQIHLRTPSHYVFSGAWDQTFEIKIVSDSVADREELVDIVSIGLQHIMRDSLLKAGIFIKKIDLNGESEEEYANDFIYIYTITVSTFSEWSREVPVRNIIERINLYFKLISSGITPTPFEDTQSNLFPNSSELIAILT